MIDSGLAGSVVILHAAGYSAYLSNPSAKRARTSGPVAAVEQSPGIAIRLYEEDDFKARPEFTDAEILRTNLASVVLQCLDLSLGDPVEFPFVDPPEPQSIRDGIQQLRELDLVTPKVRLTKLGRRVANIPLDPRIGRILLDAESRRVFWEVSIVASRYRYKILGNLHLMIRNFRCE